MNPQALLEVPQIRAGPEHEGEGEVVGRYVARAHGGEEENSHVGLLVFLKASYDGVPDEGVWLANFVEHLVSVGHVAQRRAACDEVTYSEAGLVESCDYHLGMGGFEAV